MKRHARNGGVTTICKHGIKIKRILAISRLPHDVSSHDILNNEGIPTVLHCSSVTLLNIQSYRTPSRCVGFAPLNKYESPNYTLLSITRSTILKNKWNQNQLDKQAVILTEAAPWVLNTPFQEYSCLLRSFVMLPHCSSAQHRHSPKHFTASIRSVTHRQPCSVA